MTQPLAPATEPTHGCVRCGAPVPIADGMCERCNPLGLKQPAASQAHGTVVLGIDEATAAIVRDGIWQVRGAGRVTIWRGRRRERLRAGESFRI